MKTCLSCGASFKSWLEIDGRWRNLTSRKFCLTCSPFKHHNTKQLNLKTGKIEPREPILTCLLCGKLKKIKDRRRHCQACNTKIRRYRLKLWAVHYKGGYCKHCKGVFNLHAFEFHHPNDNKEFTIGQMSNKSIDILKKEIDKCDLLCSNCHRIAHSGIHDELFIQAVYAYRGKIPLPADIPTVVISGFVG